MIDKFQQRLPELDGLRGIAILGVMLFHYAPVSGPLHALAPVFLTGWAGVDLFFVLSGFLITGILADTSGKPRYYRNFIARRALRILPLYYACLFLYCLLQYLPGTIQWTEYARHAGWYFVYAGNVRVALDNGWPAIAILTPLWSLQVEEQFYLTYPFLVARAPRRTLAFVLAALSAAALVLRTGAVMAAPDALAAPYVLTPFRMDALAFGGLLAIAWRERPDLLLAKWLSRAAIGAAVIFVGISALSSNTPWSIPMRTIGYTALDLACAGLLAAVLSDRHKRLLAILRSRVLVRIGVISYGLYLLHIAAPMIVHGVIDRWVNIPFRGSADLFLSFAAAIAAASISWRFFETPILKLKTRFTSDR